MKGESSCDDIATMSQYPVSLSAVFFFAIPECQLACMHTSLGSFLTLFDPTSACQKIGDGLPYVMTLGGRHRIFPDLCGAMRIALHLFCCIFPFA